MINAKAHMIC